MPNEEPTISIKSQGVTPAGKPGFDKPRDWKGEHAVRLAKVIADPKNSLAIAKILIGQNSRSVSLIEALDGQAVETPSKVTKAAQAPKDNKVSKAVAGRAVSAAPQA